LIVLAKTGTPDGYRRAETWQLSGSEKYYDIGQFVFSLMRKSSFDSLKYKAGDADEKTQGKIKGITCVVRITRIYDQKTDDTGLWSKHAREFFAKFDNGNNRFDEDAMNRLKKLYHMTQKYY
jgi:hypothetical protein